MYNSGIKEEFINNISAESNKPKYLKLFKDSQDFEVMYGKDIGTFDFDELEEYFHHLSPKSENVAYNSFRLIRDYVDWAILKAIKNSNLNPLNGIEREWVCQFVVGD
jgi:hypothetical protein